MKIQTYSVFEYLYRDANNYKAWGNLLLLGQLSESQILYLQSCCESGEFFVAEDVGIPPLQKQLWQYSNGPTAADHDWHSFHAIRPATSQEIPTLVIWGTAEELLIKFSNRPR